MPTDPYHAYYQLRVRQLLDFEGPGLHLVIHGPSSSKNSSTWSCQAAHQPHPEQCMLTWKTASYVAYFQGWQCLHAVNIQPALSSSLSDAHGWHALLQIKNFKDELGGSGKEGPAVAAADATKLGALPQVWFWVCTSPSSSCLKGYAAYQDTISCMYAPG